MRYSTGRVLLSLLVAFGLVAGPASAATHRRAHHHGHVQRAAVARRTGQGGVKLQRVSYLQTHITSSRLHARRARALFNPWTSPTFADSTAGDSVDGEDLTVRRAAVQALGPYNGAVVVTDPFTGRILSIVNQKLALKSGFQPCSTIKLVAAIAGLSEGVISPEENLRIGRRWSIDLTQALAHSNNYYFATVGNRLGFEKVSTYAHLLGLGEKAGWNIEGEEAGILPQETPEEGMGMMTSFGIRYLTHPAGAGRDRFFVRQRRHPVLFAVSEVARGDYGLPA